MTFRDDLRALLVEELASPEAETGLHTALITTSLLLDFVATLVDERDTGALRALCHDHTPLHELTAELEKVVGALPMPEQQPYVGCDPESGAVRCAAALGLALVDDENQVDAHLETALIWLRYTNASAGSIDLGEWKPPEGDYQERLQAIGKTLGQDGFAPACLAWLLELAGARRRGAEAAIDVLLDRGDTGLKAKLWCAALPGVPGGLVPDPRSMAFFTADDRFRSGLESAWRNAGGDSAVAWSLIHLDGPADHVDDISLTAAFTVLLDEVRRLGRKVRGPFTVRRITAGTAVVGGVSESGKLISVTGYDVKIPAAADLTRVVVPPEDLAVARKHALNLHTQVDAAGTWQDAARTSRRRSVKAMLRIALVVLALLLVSSSVGGGVWWDQQRRQAVRDASARAAERALDVANGSDPALSLLLAMASDDLAREVHAPAEKLDQFARGLTSLRRVLRPEQGRFDKVELSRNGSWALLASSTGAVDLISTKAGDVLWRRSGGGVEAPAKGVYARALALSPKGQRAAVATTDRRITLLLNKEREWSEAAQIDLPLPSSTGPLNNERNAVSAMSFTPDGKALVAYVGTTGLFRYDPANPANPPALCPAPPGATALATTKDSALLVSDHQVTRVAYADCSQTVMITASSGVILRDTVDDSELVVAATRGRELLLLRPDQPEVRLSDRGPFWAVSITPADDQPHITAASERGTYGYEVNEGLQEFGYQGSGPSASAMGVVLRFKEGVAELHDNRHTPATIAWSPFVGGGQEIEWAGPDLVVRGNAQVGVVSNAASKGPEEFASPSSYRLLDLPENTTTRELATTRNGSWAAVLYAAKQDSQNWKLLVWNVTDGKRAQVVLPDTQMPFRIAFVGGDLYVGYISGDLKRFRLHDGNWLFADERRLSDRVMALGGRDEAAEVYAVVGKDKAAPPTVVALAKSDLSPTAETTLEGGTALVHVAVLSDGQVVIGHGAGSITFLTPQLELRGTHSDGRLQFVNDVTEVPGLRQVLVSGRVYSMTLDQVTRSPLADSWSHGAPFLSAAASRDDRVLATLSDQTRDVTMWTLEQSDLRDRVCRAVGRDLTEEEWTKYVGTDQPYRSVCPR
ncbi:hypothetical protein ACIGNX_34525 [Actinosynnema sp. NPDC053489]|uniref:hypothetical protein n=1 Tax=Actinosynnema sp. NPDC053489 TaxID=3363916 RepID=UPI0037C84321